MLSLFRLSSPAVIAPCAALLAFALPTMGRSAGSATPVVLHSDQPAENLRPADIFESMRKNFNAAASKGVHAHYQFNISGQFGGAWWVIVNDGEFTMGRGWTEKPDVIMASTDRDWVMLVTGSLSGFRAFLTGRLRVTGSQGLARKLGVIFP
jgi:putative sterol carrier protein